MVGTNPETLGRVQVLHKSELQKAWTQRNPGFEVIIESVVCFEY